jgi:hypothetical protein
MNNLVKLPNHTGKRIQILTPTELEALYERPAFTQEERMSFFLLKPEEKILLDLPTSLETKIHVILQLGYFNCKHHFFEFTLDEVKEDTEYVLNQYFEQIAIKKTVLTREVKRQNQQRVLEITGYKIYNGAQHEAVLLNRAKELCRISMDPMFIFNEILSLLAQNKITLPGYSTLQEKIISRAIKAEQNRIGLILEANLSTKDRGQIMLLFKEDDGFYAITVLKKEPGNFKLRAIRKESAMFSLYQPLYLIAKRILPLFDISQKAIAYYASLVEHYTVRGLMRLEAIQRYLWLICFIQDRYQRMLYNLTTMFIYTFNQYQEAINKKAKERLLTHVLEPSDQDVKTAQLLRNYTSDEIDTSQPFEKIRQNAYQNILSADQINYIADTLEDKKKGEKLLIQFRWEAIALLAKSYKLPLRTLIKVLPIEGDRHKPLKEGQKFLQTTFLQSKSLNLVRFDLFPLKFIGKNDTPYIYDEELKSIDVDRYEFECYRQLVAHIQDYSLFVPDSFHYENFSSQILQNWKERKGEILAKLNRPFLNKPFSEFIAERANPLDARIRRVNEAIKNGENKAVKIKSNKDGSQRWSIPYTKNSLGVNNTIYEKLPPVNILRILQFSNKKTHFMQQLTHIKPHYAKSKQDDMMNYLNLLARATNMQKRELASLTGLSLAQLETADSNYFRLETLREANNTLNNELAKLSVFRHWYLLPDKLHASLDGIKLTTASETLLSRYSPKYFGLGKGVTGYYLIVNHAAVNTLTHGPNEHESHFVFDMAYNNHSDLQPDIFSTDTEGSNQLNFLLLHVIDRLFAPRYKSFNKGSSAHTIKIMHMVV